MRNVYAAAVLAVLLISGCRYCTSRCDDLPPVPEIPYDIHGPRVASAFGGPAFIPARAAEPLPEFDQEQPPEAVEEIESAYLDGDEAEQVSGSEPIDLPEPTVSSESIPEPPSL